MAAVIPSTFEDVVAAVHGIGLQTRYSTARSVATQLAASVTLTRDLQERNRTGRHSICGRDGSGARPTSR